MTDTPQEIMARVLHKINAEDRLRGIAITEVSTAMFVISALKEAGYEITPTKETLSDIVLSGIERISLALEDLGMVIVPVEPTEAMIEAGQKADDTCLTSQSPYYTATFIYKAMIEAVKASTHED